MKFFNDNVTVSVSIKLPWRFESWKFNYSIDAFMAREALTPLPRTREIDAFAAQEAAAKRAQRRRIADIVASEIVASLLTAVEHEDTILGYKRDEIRAELEGMLDHKNMEEPIRSSIKKNN